MRSGAHALVLAAVWLSPPALLALVSLLLADGIRGLWIPLALGGGSLIVAVLVAGPWSRLPTGGPDSVLRLLRHRWPEGGRALAPLAVASAASALLFLWAQLAAGRELAQALGWSPPAAVAVAAAAVALAGWRRDVAWRLTALGGALAVGGLVLPLAAILGATDPVWPRVWAAVASRPRVTFAAESPWVREGRPVRGTGPVLRLPVAEEQRVTLLGRGRIHVELWESRTWSRDVRADTDLALRPGDRLVVPDGFPIRFQAGRTVSGAPPSGPDWLDPPGPRPDWRTLAGLGVTLLVGALGLAPVHAALPAGRSAGAGTARAGAVLVTVGVVAAMLWSLYAAWLTPEVYIGGVAGTEVFALPASLSALGTASAPLADVTMLALAGGGVAAALAALRAVPQDLGGSPGRRAGTILGVVAVAGVLAAVTPARPWPVLLAAFGLGASATAPAIVLGCWRERLSERGVAVGAALGLVLYVALTLLGLLALGRVPETSWLRSLAAWPALVATPANALAVWLLSAAPRPSPRSPLPPALADLHA